MGCSVSYVKQPQMKLMLRSFWLSVLKLMPHSRRDGYLFQAILSSPYLVYTSLAPNPDQRIFYAFDIKYGVRIALPYFDGALGNSATAAMGGRLYVIGGLHQAAPLRQVMAFDPTTQEWVDAGNTGTARNKAVAVPINGTICVFGGCDPSTSSWAEEYDGNARKWNIIPLGSSLRKYVGEFLSQPVTAAIETNRSPKIYLQSTNGGIMIDFANNRCQESPHALRAHWRTHSTAAVVHNIIFTCHSENPGAGAPAAAADDAGAAAVDDAGAAAAAAGEIVRVGAYYPPQNVWLSLQGLDNNFHENARTFHFLSVHGKLVIYQKSKRHDPLKFLVFDVTPNFDDARVTVKFLWEFNVPGIDADLVLSVPAHS